MIGEAIYQMSRVLGAVYLTIGCTLVLASAIVWLSGKLNPQVVRR